MSLRQFMRILWARRAMVLVATLGALVAAFIVTLVLPARYEASSRVLLDIVKPDPVTGEVIGTAFARAYTKTQTELIRDYRVAGQVVDELGWAQSADLQRSYLESTGAEDLSGLRRWLAQIIIANTGAKLIEGSNILEITYTGNSPDNAKRIADALRQAYNDVSLSFRRDTAGRTARWYEGQGQKARAALVQADAAKTKFERENGIILQDDKTDVDSIRLAALAGVSASPQAVAGAVGGRTSSGSTQLAAIDAQIAAAARQLGPNHPEMQNLRQQRAAIAAAAGRENAAAGTVSAPVVTGPSVASQYEAQRARVIGQRDKLERLRQLQSEVDLRREQYVKSVARAAELRQESEVLDAGLTFLGSAVAPEKPVSPNKPVILLGAFGFGLGFGVLLALLIELLGRRVRGVEDIQQASAAPLLAVIEAPQDAASSGRSIWNWLGIGDSGRRYGSPGARPGLASDR